ncbi:MAG: PCRF domain-containing protein, partial [Firmicutes bacterium]|nr:PCRF domain-containing protein [Bacillota bacterium]
MFDKLNFILEKYEELSLKVSDPDVISNQPVWKKHMKELGELEPIAFKYREYKKAKEEEEAAREMLDSDDEEMKELAKMELSDLDERIPEIEKELKILMLPKDPNDDRNVILEVRAGTGGDEAALFGM